MLTFSRSTIWTMAAVGAMLSGARLCSAAQAVKVFDPSFELPVVTDPSGIARAPSAAAQGAGLGDSPWIFSGVGGSGAPSGVVAKGAVFDNGDFSVDPPPDGNQWAYVGAFGGEISQSLTFPAAGTYTLSFDTNGLYSGIGAGIDSAIINLSATQIPQSTVVQRSGSFTVTAGPHVLAIDNNFSPAGPGPVPPALIDAVAVVPEPCCVLCATALLMLRRGRLALI